MRLCLIAAFVLLSGCERGLPGKAGGSETANPITQGQISVTPLGDVPTASGPGPAAPEAPKPTAASAGPTDPAPSAGPAEASPVAPPTPLKSAAQMACEKTRGAWVKAGKTGTMTCQRPLRDGGKQCRRDRDCEGECLARSRTCAPFTPMLGCNEVLQNNGQRVTLCIN